MPGSFQAGPAWLTVMIGDAAAYAGAGAAMAMAGTAHAMALATVRRLTPVCVGCSRSLIAVSSFWDAVGGGYARGLLLDRLETDVSSLVCA